MKVRDTSIRGVRLVATDRHEDARGSFYRAYCCRELCDVLEGRTIRQINVSRTTTTGSIRGLHFQYPPRAEMKFIRCLAGAVWDVAVDLRRGSDTFLRWEAFRLEAGEANMLVIPEGCAHGFQTLAADSQLLYLHTEDYAPACEGGLRYDDPRLGIAWPLPVGTVSERDRGYALSDAFEGIAP